MNKNSDLPGDALNEPSIVPGLDGSEDPESSSAEPAVATPGLRQNGGMAGSVMQQRFRVVFRGYDRRQVDLALAETGRARPSFHALGQRVAEILRLAEIEAEQIRTAAARDATRLRDTATRDAQELRQAAEESVIEMRRRWAALLADMSAARDDLTTILDRSRTIDLDAEANAPVPRTAGD